MAIVFITRATSGFGRACAAKFASDGYDLILYARREDRLNQLCTTLENRYNIAAITIPFDVRDEEKVLSSIAGLSREWRNIDVLFNNAVLALGRDYFDEPDLSDWNTMIDTNIK